ncbi:MAG TPA: 30S ribosomal protein S3ae [Methanoregulaceae archaeon]|nr:MAG: 30S ribosomal protein S3ae [Methanolinea sp.]HON80794.1 30S ribosomal protein S3ae [Methanoregulaceae archaeon]HPD09529.1 30S ribosomal protein S3ae [Methanoregulaceae archaeon]HRT14680.1 30S ribosomal protein S3ae [Methanoregulaceae archaeon]HRU30253.1 30S ribosomal protein S3ae [Methanoregulaceae archaeon]
MARKKQAGRRVEGWKAKSWYKVYGPDSLGKTYIGDTIANDPENVVGRIMQTTLGEIINDYARQNVKMKFRVSDVAGDAAYTEFIGHELTRDYLRSLVKRRTSRIDCHVPVTTKDGKKVDLTVTCYTLTRANLSQTHAIRGLMAQKVGDMAKEGDFNALLNGIITGEISKAVFKAIKPLFPVRRVEIIKSKVGTVRAA